MHGAHGQAHGQSIRSVTGGVPVVRMSTCVGGCLQHLEGDMIIGHCAVHWSIHSFIHSQSVNTCLVLSTCGTVLFLGIKLNRTDMLCTHRVYVILREREN